MEEKRDIWKIVFGVVAIIALIFAVVMINKARNTVIANSKATRTTNKVVKNTTVFKPFPTIDGGISKTTSYDGTEDYTNPGDVFPSQGGTLGQKPSLEEPRTEEVTTVEGEQETTTSSEEAEGNNIWPSYKYAAADRVDQFFDNSVFVGDSITVGFSSYATSKGKGFFSNPYFLCKVGYSTLKALSSSATHPMYNGYRDYVYKNVSRMTVDKVFISFGLNDIGWASNEKLVERYEILIKNIEKYSPGVRVYVLSTTYICEGREKEHLTNAAVRNYNLLVRQMCMENGYGYIDVSTMLCDSNGYMKKEYSTDKYVHLNKEAYKLWENKLREYAKMVIDAGGDEDGPISGEQPTSSVQQPTSGVQEPTSGVQQPTSGVEEPTDEVEEPTQDVESPTDDVDTPTTTVEENN